MLFRPFDPPLWFGLGFCFFLAHLVRGIGANFKIPSRAGGLVVGPGGRFDPWEEVLRHGQWLINHLTYAVGFAAASMVVITLLGALLFWLRSRGTFMMIDGLAFGRGLVKDPWRQYRYLGNSLFRFNLVAWLIMSAVTLAAYIVAVIVALPDIENQVVGTRLVWAIIIVVVVWPLAWVNYLIVEMLLLDFIAPTMYLRDVRVGAAWSIWCREVFRGHFWRLTLFYLMKLVLTLAVLFAMGLAMCLTCCLPILPYLGTVILLPAYVFMRCYTLYFLEQFGEPWRLFVYEEGSVICLACGYDLRGNPGAPTCPECGAATPAGP